MTEHNYVYLPLAGTWGEDDSWHQPGSWFEQEAAQWGIRRVGRTLRFWSSAIGGLWATKNDHRAWQYGGEQILNWQERIRREVPPGEFKKLIIVGHSWGGAVAAYALSFGAQCDTLITVGTPPRRELDIIWEAGRDNRRQHACLYGTGWKSWIRVAGARRLKRTIDGADLYLPLSGGHSGNLRDPEHQSQWPYVWEWVTR